MTSLHSLKRAKERLGFNRKKAASIIEKAIKRGRVACTFRPGAEREWLEKRSQNGCQALVYNGLCIIVSPTGNCVTVYELPQWFGKKAYFDHRKRRIRNCAKYQKMCCVV